MEIELSKRQMDELAYKVAMIVQKKLRERESEEELVTTEEAAKMLGITPGSMRRLASQHPGRYPSVKRGETKQSRTLYYKKYLVEGIHA